MNATDPLQTIQPATPPGESSKNAHVLWKPGVIPVLALLAVAGILYGAFFLWHALTHESTDDAFVDGHIVAIAPKISGKILAVHITDNQEVKKGDLLFEIDPRDYEAVVQQKKAALQVASAQYQSAEAAEQQSRAHLRTIEAALGTAKAGMDAAQASAKRQRGDLDRNQKLVSGGAISQQDYEHSSLDTVTADANLETKASEVRSAADYLEEVNLQGKAAEAQRSAAEAEIVKAKAELAQAELQLSYTKVVAPEDGRVTNKAIEPGTYVQTGQSLFALVPHEVWVTANFKESQIGKMRAGQPATVTVDAYPGRALRARVDSIQAGSGARFSLMPPENATGNYVKVVQRVPVKIVFTDSMEHLLGPGMSAVPEVQVPESLVALVVIAVLALVAIVAVFVATIFWLNKIRTGEASG
jgi:membrane fusion protein (multidrug efflux system)